MTVFHFSRKRIDTILCIVYFLSAADIPRTMFVQLYLLLQVMPHLQAVVHVRDLASVATLVVLNWRVAQIDAVCEINI